MRDIREMRRRIDITDECKSEARERLLYHLGGVRVWNTPFVDAAEVLTDWLAEVRDAATNQQEQRT